MVELKIYLSDSLNERFRKTAMNVYGYGRGSLSKAAEEALTKWCVEHGEPSKQAEGPKAESGRAEHAQSGINPDERRPDAETSVAISEDIASRPVADNHR
jgi:hypothetical protein